MKEIKAPTIVNIGAKSELILKVLKNDLSTRELNNKKIENVGVPSAKIKTVDKFSEKINTIYSYYFTCSSDIPPLQELWGERYNIYVNMSICVKIYAHRVGRLRIIGAKVIGYFSRPSFLAMNGSMKSFQNRS